MCGRFTLKGPPNQIAKMLGLDIVPNLEPRYNIAPTQDVIAVRMEDGGRAMVKLKWGLVPFWAEDLSIGSKMINARADTVAEKPAFREAFRSRRCLIPADGFYEWQSRGKGAPKQPFHIHRPDGEPFTFAGLWERWEKGGEPVETFTIVTTDAPESLKPIHHRAPVILLGDHMEHWLATSQEATDGLAELLTALPDGELIADPVTTLVNNVRNDSPDCLEPANEDEPQPAPKSAQGDLFG
ncbi:MAG: SOS response-associated peptidase [Alphaproteobacteria bacterium]|jgi:putative SOS response-associated peptidase YedK|nr:SOS response-associated peptidase [Rhodospirillaceae bacterium]MDG2482131.1 SOS response-associated peptidase [Alphaproteobacteria bacterium]